VPAVRIRDGGNTVVVILAFLTGASTDAATVTV
jgi:hypothetical protein